MNDAEDVRNERDIDLAADIYRNIIDLTGQEQNYKTTLTNWSTGVTTGGCSSIFGKENVYTYNECIDAREGKSSGHKDVILGGGNDKTLTL